VNACPEAMGVEHGFSGPPSGDKYRTADGNDGIQDKGERDLPVATENYTEAGMKMRVAQVHKPLAAASAVADQGNAIIISNKGSAIITDPDVVEKIAQLVDADKKKIKVYRKRGIYTFPVWLRAARKPKGKVDEKKGIAAMDGKEEDAAMTVEEEKAFYRQSAWM